MFKKLWHNLYWSIKCEYFNWQTRRAISKRTYKKHWPEDWCFFYLILNIDVIASVASLAAPLKLRGCPVKIVKFLGPCGPAMLSNSFVLCRILNSPLFFYHPFLGAVGNRLYRIFNRNTDCIPPSSILNCYSTRLNADNWSCRTFNNPIVYNVRRGQKSTSIYGMGEH